VAFNARVFLRLLVRWPQNQFPLDNPWAFF
jgi:hypothetical protein